MKFIAFGIALVCTCFSSLADWEYGSSTDKMSGKTTSYATIDSKNSLNLGFPYRGQNHGQISVYKHPRFGTNVTFKIERGQILCNSYQGCEVMVRFDENPPMKFSGTEAADHDSTIVFINNTAKFIAEAGKAKKILVSVSIYQNGNPVLEHLTAKSLDWKPGK